MEEIILRLLNENGRIILPDFGAIIIKQKSPLKVIFNEFLQYNDGAFIGAVERHFKIDREDAEKKVKSLAEEFAARLEKGEGINLPQIGILQKSSTGKIAFAEIENTNVKEEKIATPNVTDNSPLVEFDIQTEPSEKIPEPEKTAKKPARSITTKIEKEVISEVTNANPGPKVQGTKTPEPRTEIKPEVKIEDTAIPEPKKEVRTEVKIEANKPVFEYPANEPERNRLNLFIWIAVIVIVNGAIISYFLFDGEIKSFFGKTPYQLTDSITKTTISPSQQVVAQTDTAVPENIIPDIKPEETSNEPKITELTTTIPVGTKYYVVAGVFRDEANADKLVKELRGKSYNAEKFGKIGKSFAVSYAVFSTKQEADEFMNKLKQDTDPGAWIKVID